MDRYSSIIKHLLSYVHTALIMVIIMIGLSGMTFAQPEQNDLAQAETGIEFQPRLGEYHYEITWGPNRIGTGVITIEREGDIYILKAEKKTTGLFDKVYRLRYAGEARIKATDLAPVDSIIVEESRKRKKVQVVEYPDSKDQNTVKVIETKSRDKEKSVEIKEFEFTSDTSLVDLFSAIFLARSFDWQVGERHEFIVFVGSKQYLVHMDCIGEATIAIGGETLAVWVIQPTSRKLDDEGSTFTHENTFVYLSADESKDIIKVKSKIGVGSVKLKFVKYKQ